MTGSSDYSISVPPSTVLVCDDDDDIRTVITAAIQAMGHKVIETRGGQEAIDFCKQSLPDAVVMDVMMPEVTGHDFVRWLRKGNTDSFVPVLFLTALSEIDNRVEGLELGADGYLTKPFNYRELQARVGALLRIKMLTNSLIAKRKEIEEKNRELSRMQGELVKKERELVAAQLAGAAAHNLGQPLTTILLNCSIIEKFFIAGGGSGTSPSIEQAKKALQMVQRESNEIRKISEGLQQVDANSTEQYVGDISILNVERGK